MARIVNSNRTFLPCTDARGQPLERFLHLATIHDNTREFMCFADVVTNNVYIEEIQGGSLCFIQDDVLVAELRNLLLEATILDMSKPFLSDKKWLRSNEA